MNPMHSPRNALRAAIMACLLAATLSAAAQQVTGYWNFDDSDNPFDAVVGTDGSIWTRTEGCEMDLGEITEYGLSSDFGAADLPDGATGVMYWNAALPCTGYLFPHGAAANGDFDPPFDIEEETIFGLASELGVDLPDGDAGVMYFPACDQYMGYSMYSGLEENGGGIYVNQYTIIMDLYYPADSATWRSLYSTNECAANDGDLYIRPDGGLGISGQYAGTVSTDTWHRVAWTVDMTVDGAELNKYIDGVLVGTQALDGIDGRWTLYTASQGYPTLLFTDDSSDTAPGYCAAVQIRDGAATPDEVEALGGVSAAGIPTSETTSGYWNFEDAENGLAATVGNDLEWFRGCVSDVPRVNQYTVITDIYISAEDYFAELEGFNGGWQSIYTTYLENDNDALLWIRKSDGNIGDDGAYAPSTIFSCEPDTWLRIVCTVDEVNDYVGKYVTWADGTYFVASQGGSGLNGKRSLITKEEAGVDHLLFFSDYDYYVGRGLVSAIQVRDYAMTEEDALALGGPTAAGIPLLDAPVTPGDMNCDGAIDFDDIDPFVVAIIDQAGFEAAYPDCNYSNGDTNRDGAVDFDDIDSMVECIINGEC
jgi:hypothetical protein